MVLTHTNTDFDSLASAVALAKLWSIERSDYPTHVVMPRGSNPHVQKFLTYHKHLLPLRGFSTIQPEDVQMVGVVDTQSRDRLGPAERWLANASHVAVWDHHTAVKGDIDPDELVLETTGSLTTVLVEKLQEREVELTEAEASLFALGIRADTGALSYVGTSPRDGEALVWLMKHGASQSAIAEFGHARLSAVQRDVLAEALQKTTRIKHEGVSIGTVHVHTGRGFITGLAAVAEELLQLMSLEVVLLGVVHQNAKGQPFLSLIGRAGSRASSVDLNEVMERWGGGGHAAASACSLRLSEAEEVATAAMAADDGDEGQQVRRAALAQMETAAYGYLAQALQQVVGQLPTQKTATDLMTKKVFCVSPDDSMDEARLTMLRVGKKSTPVVDADGKFVGVLKYNAVIKAAKANKQAQQVKAWMRRDVTTCSASTPLDELELTMESSGAGRLPVVDDEGKLLGLVTRTDVLRERNLYDQIGASAQLHKKPQAQLQN